MISKRCCQGPRSQSPLIHTKLIKAVAPRLCPRQFGHPNRRLRVWRILFDKETKKWSADRSLGELANLILAPIETKPELDFNAYLWASPNELEGKAVKEEDLTRCIVSKFSLIFDVTVGFHVPKSFT